MKLTRPTIVRASVLIAVVGVSWWGYAHYRAGRTGIDKLIKNYEEDIAWKEQDAAEMPKVNAAMREVARTTLGADEESVNAELRSALNSMIARLRIAEASVSTSSATSHINPAAKSRLPVFTKAVRDRSDFLSVAATVSGKGTLDQAIQLLALIEAQPWAHRIDGFLLRPLGKERERMDISITLSTIFLPDSKPLVEPGTGGPKPLLTELPPAQWARWEPVSLHNVFRAPPPPPTVAAANPEPPRPAPPAAPTLGDWRLTGVVRGRSGPEMWVRNDKSQETLILNVGGKVLEAEFVDGGGEVARIKIGNDLFEVRLGSALSERKPTIQ